jgi:hypothetical protein
MTAFRSVLGATPTAKTKVMITVTPTASGRDLYDVCLESGRPVVKASRQPFLDAARALLNCGADPAMTLEMWHDGALHYAMRAPLSHAAKLAVEERIRGGKPPRFVPYRAFNRAAVATGIAAKRQTIDRGPTRNSGSRNATPAAQ